MENQKQLFGIDRQSKLPLYDQIEQNLRDLIAMGSLKEGDSIPPEFELAELYGVSRLTLRRAMDNLVRKNLLTRRHGVGTFVNKPTIASIAPSKLSFTDQMLAIGRAPSSHLIRSEIIPAPPHVAEILNLENRGKVIETTRLRLADGVPILIEKSYLSESQYPMVAETYQWAESSLYQFLAERYNVIITGMDQTLRPILLSEAEAQLLEVQSGSPAIQSDVVAFSMEGETVEYAWSVSSSRDTEFYFRFRRGEVNT